MNIETDPDNEKGKKDTPYNFSLFYYVSLSKLIEEKDRAYLNDDLNQWFKCLDRIYKRLCFKLNVAENNIFKEMFFEAKKKIEAKDKESINTLHAIDEQLYKSMDKYKMIFPRADSIYGLGKIDDRYGLKGYYEKQ